MGISFTALTNTSAAPMNSSSNNLLWFVMVIPFQVLCNRQLPKIRVLVYSVEFPWFLFAARITLADTFFTVAHKNEER
jgi:hypothetical protein